MDTNEAHQVAVSDSDSDDEFFDALANEESKGGREEKEFLSRSSGDDHPSVQSVENRVSLSGSGSGETAQGLPSDRQPGQEETLDVGSVSKTELNIEENCDSSCSRLKESVQVLEKSGGDACSNFADNANVENEQTSDNLIVSSDTSTGLPVTSDDSTIQPVASKVQELTQDEEVCEGLEAEEKEDDRLQEEGENVEEEKIVEDEMEMRQQREDAMTNEERENLKEEAQSHKAKGNNLFKQDEFLDAISSYSQALEVCPLCFKKERSIMYANRAACRVRREQNEMAIEDCNKALELHPHYLKVWLRRANTYELMEKLDEALADFKQVLELDPSSYEARAACMRLPEQIKVRNEKLKEEMFGKLKDLGNLVLRPFGLSTDNFQMQQDPNTGSYSVNFRQNPTSGNGRP
ncbi:tetratricopeptide repeat protein 1-like [Lytechinus variegatus]|uniref:tetratricopeptide repeat protein 1-like n=1 Tax=Lytechinus variegatus TaxID=7654 RepID=UPI001BB27025|nr:tetratricopeptide repeat protein 1-like [Lytechinus variegatus]XP_041477100.1 tetratricopeptide repeat protein 1-like [Lytechinus variegatus]